MNTNPKEETERIAKKDDQNSEPNSRQNANGSGKPGGNAFRSRSVLFGDPRDVDRAINNTIGTVTKTGSDIAAKWGLGWTKNTPKPK